MLLRTLTKRSRLFSQKSEGWPGPSEGTAVYFDLPRRERLAEIYWFATYTYGPVSIELSVDPATGEALFGEPADPPGGPVPPPDEIWDFGILGFGQEGYNPCGAAMQTGACCLGDECRIVTREECEAIPGQYQGDNTRCFPNPCREQVIETSWGRLKGLYR